MHIHAIQTGRLQTKQAQIEGRGRGVWRQLQPILSSEWAEWVPVYAWAIEHPEACDCCRHRFRRAPQTRAASASVFSAGVRFDVEPEQEVGPQLCGLGISECDVKTLVHDGGLAYFPNPHLRRCG